MSTSNITQLLRDILHTKNWLESIRRKFWKIVPYNTASIISLTIVSQVFFMVAFLLPIKIIMMLGSGGMPKYIPDSLASLGYETLILSLSGFVFVFYLFYILCEKGINYLVDKGAAKLLAHTGKSSLFENQEQVALNAYMKYARANAGFIFGILVIVGLFFVYQKLFFFLIGYFIVSIGIVGLLVVTSEKFYDYLISKTSVVLSTISNLGFFAVFLFMVYDILFANAKLNFIIIIVSVILSRQLLSQLSSSIQNIKAIYNQRIKINALFYHGHTLNHTTQVDKNHFWNMIEDNQSLKNLIIQVLEDLLDQKIINFSYCWYDLRVPNIATFKVNISNTSQSYLIQLFNTNQSSVAKHQLDFFEKSDRKLFLEFCGACIVEQCHCHVFKLNDEQQFKQKELKQANVDFFINLMKHSPNDELVDMYKKSKPMLSKRIHLYIINRVSLAVSNQKQKDTIDYFRENFETIMSQISRLPLCYVNPVMGVNLLNKENNLSALFWGRWSLEPIGVNFPIGRLKGFEKKLEDIKLRREELKDISFEAIAMVANLSEFERLSSRMNYIQALDRLEEVIMYFEKIENDKKTIQ